HDILDGTVHETPGRRSKHTSEFQSPGAPVMDFVFTVCDTAAAEDCPPWPGQPITGHWGLPDPVKATGTDAEKALVFAQTYAALRRRIAAFVELPFGWLNRMSLQSRVDAIGTDTEARAGPHGPRCAPRPRPDRQACPARPPRAPSRRRDRAPARFCR